MAKYHVSFDKVPKGHAVPAVLRKFADWLAQQDHRTLGWFDALAADTIAPTWNEGAAERLQKAGFSFLCLPDGSLLALLDTGARGAPLAVVLLGSEGEARTVATSLEELLELLSKGETEIAELDDEEASGARSALKTWLKKTKVKAPKAPDFDFQAWLDGDANAAPPANEITERPEPASFRDLPPRFRELALMHGLRADDAKLMAFVQAEGGKVPKSISEDGDAKEVKSKRGFSLWFGYDILNDAFPLVRKTANSFVPYVEEIDVARTWKENLPFGLDWKQTEREVEACLGEPIRLRNGSCHWEKPLDPGRSYLEVSVGKHLSILVRAVVTFDLTSPNGVPPRPVVGLFVAWALSRGILDESRFPQHKNLIARIKRREAQGSAFVDAALPRGLWQTHLCPDPKLQSFAFRLIRGTAELSLNNDLQKVFGSRKHEYSPDEANLGDDTWVAVDQATPVLDERFAPWIGVNTKP